jgi:predicted  nucleic acid-binding Zn-ribbon protein
MKAYLKKMEVMKMNGLRTRPKTDISRKAELKADGLISIKSDVLEELTPDQFFETLEAKNNQLSQFQNQLSAIKSQITTMEKSKPVLSATEQQDLDLLKKKMDHIKMTERLEALKVNAQKVEVEIDILQKEMKVLQEVVEKLSQQSPKK